MGISTSPTWWTSTQGSGFNYAVTSAGAIPFKVILPAASALASATGQPTGSVTTGGATGMILPNGTKASFLFSTLDGTVSGWNSKLGTANAIVQIAVNNTSTVARYPGLAILNTTNRSFILAPNFGTGNAIEVCDDTFKLTQLAGGFIDPGLPAGYWPFSIHVLGSQVFVAYALRTTPVTGTTAVSGGDAGTVYFTAGLAGEAHGLLAGITNSTTAGSTPTFGLSASPGAVTVAAGASSQAAVSIAPVNGFSGPVSLACSGLPAGATCSFSPSQVTVVPTASTIATLTIQTAKASANLHSPDHRNGYPAPISFAFFYPLSRFLPLVVAKQMVDRILLSLFSVWHCLW